MNADEAGGKPGRLEIHIEAGDIASGAVFRIEASVDGWRERDLMQQELVIRDETGEEKARAGFATIEAGIWRTAPIALEAPPVLGQRRWTAELAGEELNGISYPDLVADFDVTVARHRSIVSAWGLPPTIEAGGRARFRVGLCSTSGASAAGSGFEVRDEAGQVVHRGTVGAAAAEGTSGLSFAEVDLPAPAAPGLARWTVHARAGADGHAEGSAEIAVRTVPPPRHRVRVRALDIATGEPVEGMRVVMHPYRARTGTDGWAEFRAAPGSYTLFVSGRKYIPYQVAGELDGDLQVVAELEEDMQLTPADIWV